MATGNWIVCSAVVLFSASMWASADDTKPAMPATQPTEGRAAHTRKLTEPWRNIKDLTPEQTDQISKIHADALVQEKKIREKETDDIMALLTPAQVTEVKDFEAKSKEAMKEAGKERRAAMKKPTTAPSAQ